MSRARARVDALASVAPRFGRAACAAKLRLLGELETRAIGRPAPLLRFHETLCFLQAYPDAPDVLAGVERALAGFPRRVRGLGAGARAALRDSGVVGTTLVYPFGLPMVRWLIARYGRDADVDWRGYRQGARLDETLALLVTHAEDDAFSEGGLGWRRWLTVARGGRRLSDLQLLVELFRGAALPPAARDWLFECLELPIRVRLRRLSGARTGAKLPWPRPVFQTGELLRTGLSFVEEVRRPLSALRRAPRPLAESLIESARVAMATRRRELYAFAYPNPDDVLVAEPGCGLRIALLGLPPKFRLPLEGYYAFFVLKNGVPVSYGGGWYLFGTLEVGLNVFESFRPGESAFVFSQVLRVYRQALGMHTVVVDPYQIGHDNPEALRSGAFYFYHRLGFRPRDPAVRRLSEAERTKIARNRAYRSPLPVLRQLARSEMALTLGATGSARRVRASEVAALVTGLIVREFGGDRRAAARAAAARVARALGIPGWRAWQPDERRAFERLSLVATLIPDLHRWRGAERRALVRVFRAKGGRGELPYIRQLDRHRPFRRSLARLVAAARAEAGRQLSRVAVHPGALAARREERLTHAG